MKKMNKKGFTIVELVIVIAVIAILAAVLIPTFSNVISNAKDSAALSNAQAAYKQYLVADGTDIETENGDFVYVEDGRYVAVVNGNVVDTVYDNEADALENFTAVDNPTTEDVENAVELEDSATVDGLYAVKSVYVTAE